MDKQTLSNYGWVVIVTLILAVMLALATPFGTYVGDAVVSVANGFVGTSNEAIDEDNIAVNEDKWDSKFDYTIFEDTTQSDALTHDNVIPEGGIYVTGIKCDYINYSYTCCDYYWCWCDATTYKAGDKFPTTVQQYDMYIYGDFVYMYNGYNNYHCNRGEDCISSVIYVEGVGNISGFNNRCYAYDDTEPNYDGWCVGINNALIDGETKETFGVILETINNKPVTEIGDLFYYCSSITATPVLPSGIRNLDMTFYYCQSLKEISYNGTIAQWNSLPRQDYWNGSCLETTLICTDGTTTIPAGL